MPNFMKIFLDSGAYSSFMQKQAIDIQEYISFVKQHIDKIDVYANLDSIGSAEETWKNQEIMEKAGLNPLPVYHLDEPQKYLLRCMEYPYFAVGGLASAKGRALAPFLQSVFKKICTKESDYYPTHKIHGFGITTPSIINMFPWFSVDSGSWVMYGKYGMILIPHIRNGKYRFDLPPNAITVSSRSKAVGSDGHYRNLSYMEKVAILKYCQDSGFEMGSTLFKKVSPNYILKAGEKFTDRKKKDRVEVVVTKGLCNNYEIRDSLNLKYFLKMEKSQKPWPWQWFNQEEFSFL